MKNDRDRMKCIISETIVALCNSGLDFSCELCVEGLLGITLDGRDILLVNINEVIKSGIKTLPSRNVDTESERVYSDITTSSDPITKTAETQARISSMSSRSRERIPNQHIPAQHQTDQCDLDLHTPVKSEPVEIIEDGQRQFHSVTDNRKPAKMLWSERDIRDSAQLDVSNVDESFVFAEQAKEMQLCKMDTNDIQEQFCEQTDTSPDEASSQSVAQQQTHPVCLYSNTAPSQQASTSSANETRHSQMLLMSGQSKYRRYSQTSLMDAVMAVINHKMTSNQASRIFKVPRSTVRFQASKFSLKKTNGDCKDKQRLSVAQTVGDEADCRGPEPHETVSQRGDSVIN